MRNDEIAWERLARHSWDRIVVSPGQGRPERERDLGICRDALVQAEVPVLGVCLGHQARTSAGTAIVRAAEIVHGRISQVFHRGDGLFSGVPQGFRGVRYHSLIVEPALPTELEAIAWADDGTLMAIRDRRRGAWACSFIRSRSAPSTGARHEMLLKAQPLLDAVSMSGALVRPGPASGQPAP